MNSTINGNSTINNSTSSNSTTGYLDNQLSFTFEEGKKYFEGLNIECKTDEECPIHTTCSSNILHCNYYECRGSFHCIGHFYCIKDKSLCSFKNGYEGVKYSAYVSPSSNKFGLNDNEDCRYDTECIDGRCLRKNFWGIGHCGEPSDSDGLSAAIAFGVFIVIMIFIIASIGFCSCIILCIQTVENSKRRKKGLKEKKYKAFKPLAISLVVAILILILFFIVKSIDSHLNEQPL